MPAFWKFSWWKIMWGIVACLRCCASRVKFNGSETGRSANIAPQIYSQISKYSKEYSKNWSFCKFCSDPYSQQSIYSKECSQNLSFWKYCSSDTFLTIHIFRKIFKEYHNDFLHLNVSLSSISLTAQCLVLKLYFISTSVFLSNTIPGFLALRQMGGRSYWNICVPSVAAVDFSGRSIVLQLYFFPILSCISQILSNICVPSVTAVDLPDQSIVWVLAEPLTIGQVDS